MTSKKKLFSSKLILITDNNQNHIDITNINLNNKSIYKVWFWLLHVIRSNFRKEKSKYDKFHRFLQIIQCLARICDVIDENYVIFPAVLFGRYQNDLHLYNCIRINTLLKFRKFSGQIERKPYLVLWKELEPWLSGRS